MSASRSTPASPRRLPEQPNLDQLRKQAREVLNGYRSRDSVALAEVKRFEHNPRLDFALSDAQRVLARAYGFQSWPKLKAFVDGVNIARFAEAIQLGDMSRVRSMLASRPELHRGAPVHEADAEPWATPISWARKMNHGAIVSLLEGHSDSEI